MQFQVTGRLDNLVELVAERFKDRFFKDETVLVEVDGDRYHALVKEVFPPRPADGSAPAQYEHEVGTQLWLSQEDAARLDNPAEYLYSIQLVDNEGMFTGSIMEARAKVLCRDRLVFSKSIVRKYLRDCVVRDPQVGSPWFVRENLARRFDIPLEPTEEIMQRNEDIKEGKLSKRRKLIDGDASAARRKARDERKGTWRCSHPDRKREEDKTEKKPLKFPCEDLLLDTITEQELSAETPGELSKRAQRPELDGPELLGVPQDHFEPYMMVYYFFLSLGYVTRLSHTENRSVSRPSPGTTLRVHCGIPRTIRPACFSPRCTVWSSMRSCATALTRATSPLRRLTPRKSRRCRSKPPQLRVKLPRPTPRSRSLQQRTTET